MYRHGDHFDIRIRLADGRGKPVHLAPHIGETEARKLAAEASALAVAEGATREPRPSSGETVDAWAKRWTADRVTRGIATAREALGSWRKWITPLIGDLPIACIEREDVERVVDRLDDAVRDGVIRAPTAIRAWATLKAAFRDAQRAKNRALRVRLDNPTEGVLGPDAGPERSKPWLYPCELGALTACTRVPLRWRRTFVLATYLYLRAGELAELAVEDVDLVGGVVLVHQARKSRHAATAPKTGPTKTKLTRRVPIERTLRPLLTTLIAEATAEGRHQLIRMPPLQDLSNQLRRYLGWAGVNRAALFAKDATRAPITFHGLRATGLTWRAIRGDDALKIQRAAGHTSLDTTQRYIREAEVVGREIGVPFPDLPHSNLSVD
ncbi:MAG: site-specific integrase [Polyangiaceae bacterium]